MAGGYIKKAVLRAALNRGRGQPRRVERRISEARD